MLKNALTDGLSQHGNARRAPIGSNIVTYACLSHFKDSILITTDLPQCLQHRFLFYLFRFIFFAPFSSFIYLFFLFFLYLFFTYWLLNYLLFISYFIFIIILFHLFSFSLYYWFFFIIFILYVHYLLFSLLIRLFICRKKTERNIISTYTYSFERYYILFRKLFILYEIVDSSRPVNRGRRLLFTKTDGLFFVFELILTLHVLLGLCNYSRQSLHCRVESR